MLKGLRKLLRWRGPAPIGTTEELACAIAERAVSIAERTITEYTRMRVGRAWPRLFAEAAFQEALESACRSATPLALVWTVRVARAAPFSAGDALGPSRAASWDRIVDAAARRAAQILGDRPQCRADGLSAPAIHALLDHVTDGPPLALRDAVSRCEAAAFAVILPLDRAFTDDDRETIRNALRLLLAEAHRDFVRRIDPERFMPTSA